MNLKFLADFFNQLYNFKLVVIEALLSWIKMTLNILDKFYIFICSLFKTCKLIQDLALRLVNYLSQGINSILQVWDSKLMLRLLLLIKHSVS